MISVLKRELGSYFALPLGYIFLCVFWVLGSGFFYFYSLQAGTADLSVLFGNLSYLLILVMPLLTMRLLSEEKRQKTDQLLLCTPTSTAMAVLGKYVAALVMLLLAMAGTLIYPILLSWLTPLAFGAAASCYLGFFLLGSSYAAIGLMMSAVTENQLTAAVLTLCAYMVLQLCEMAAASVVGSLGVIIRLFRLQTHFFQFTTAVFSPVDIAYFLLFDCAAVVLSICVMQSRKLAGR